MKHGKKYQTALAAIAEKQYAPLAAVTLIKQHTYAKFDETVEIAIRLKLKKSQIVRDTFVYPHSFGKESRVLVFAEGDKAEEALKAGASYVGSQDLIDKIKGGWLDFDIAVATPDMMKTIAMLGPVLGRRGLMPNPKARTVTNDLSTTIGELKSGRVEFRSDKTGVVSLAVGKCSMSEDALVANTKQACGEIMKHKPPETKGHFFRTVTLCSTMGPGVPLDIAAVVA